MQISYVLMYVCDVMYACDYDRPLGDRQRETRAMDVNDPAATSCIMWKYVLSNLCESSFSRSYRRKVL